MDTLAHVPLRPFIEMQSESLAIAQRTEVRGSAAADISHSEENILRWMAYLPEDCIRTMVLMGWDIST
jgi:hypothetical protein